MQSQKGFEDDLTISIAQSREMNDSPPHSVPSDAWPKKNRQSREIHHPNTSLLQVHPHTDKSIEILENTVRTDLWLGRSVLWLTSQLHYLVDILARHIEE